MSIPIKTHCQNNMVELSLTDSVLVMTDTGDKHMTIKELSEFVADSDGININKIKIKVDLSCQD